MGKEIQKRNDFTNLIHSVNRQNSGKMRHSNFLLLLMVMMGGVNLCLGDPFNRSTNEEEHIVNLAIEETNKGDPFNLTSKESGTLSLKTDRVKEVKGQKASWETARCVYIIAVPPNLSS